MEKLLLIINLNNKKAEEDFLKYYEKAPYPIYLEVIDNEKKQKKK